MRELKFRAYMAGHGMTNPFTLAQMCESSPISPSDGIVDIRCSIGFDPLLNIMKFTGLQDKRGKDIYEGDILRVTYNVSSEKHQSDGIYRVILCTYSGIHICFNRLYFDDGKNQLPIANTLSFEHRTLCVDYINSNYNKICVADYSCGKVKWNSYSNNIRIVGNIYENPELLEK